MLTANKITLFIIVFIVATGVITVVSNRNYLNIRHNNSLQVSSIRGNILSGAFDQTKFKSEEEWRKILTPEQFHILREAGTEAPFSGELLHTTDYPGTYVSVGCDQPLFRSEKKYDSGTGWPSFYAPISDDSLVLREDYLLGEKRIEVLDKCGGHLGHVFDDGPAPTGKRYCINSTALKFIPDDL